MLKLRLSILAAVSALAVFAAGCGGEKTDVSQGVYKLNSQILAPQGAELDCPKEVDGGEGAKFSCDLKATDGGKSQKVDMKIVKEGGDLAVDIADQAQFTKALQAVSKQ